MARLDKVGDAHPKIEGIAVTHDPPPVPESESQIAPSQNPGVGFPVRRSRAAERLMPPPDGAELVLDVEVPTVGAHHPDRTMSVIDKRTAHMVKQEGLH